MKFSNLVFLLLLFLLAGILFAEDKVEIAKYKIKQTKGFRYGSGLAYKKASPYGKGSLAFYVFPSGDFNITNGKDQRQDLEIPHVAVLKVRKGKSATITSKFPLYLEEDQQLFVDLEGVAAAPGDFIWLADEASSSLLKVSTETGKIIKNLRAGQELPAELLKAKSNRGLESVTVTPDGKVYSFMQSPLTYEDQALSTVSFVRLIEYDEESGKSKMYALPFDSSEYLDANNIKIGDLQVLESDRFILIEQGLSKSSTEINRVFEINISEASDISNQNYQGEPLEYAPSLEELGLKYIQKKLILDLNQHGWKYRKAEGLALVSADQIAVTNDPDLLEGKDDKYEKSEIWLITLAEPLFTWSWKDKAIFYILLFILIFSTVLTVLFVLKKPQPTEETNA